MKIKLVNINKSYDNKEIIKDLNLEINSGELVSLLGPSGCGKSTTLFMVSGLESVSSGQIYFGDEDVTSLDPKERKIGMVFQNYALYPHMSVADNIMFPLKNEKKYSKEEMISIVDEVIESVGMTEHKSKKPGQLSGGQQQRVAIARAIVRQPKVLLLDEPISNLDAELKTKTIMEIRKIQKKYGITAIFVTHDQQEALAVSDRIVVLEGGSVQQVGIPNDLYLNPCNLTVAKFIGSPSMNFFEDEVKNKKLVSLKNLIKFDLNVPDGKYIFGVRPEMIKINEKSESYFEIVESEILGRDILYYCQYETTKFRVIARNNIYEKYEDTLKIEIREKDFLIFDPNTKERVENE